MFVKLLKYLVDRGVMSGYVFIFGLFWSPRGVDGHIVHVDCHASIGNEVPKDGVHHGLKRGWRIGESEEHDRGFV